MKRFRRGLVFEAHRLLHHSTLGLGVINKKKKRQGQSKTQPRIDAAKKRTGFEDLGCGVLSRVRSMVNLIAASIYHKYSVSMKIITQPDHISHCKVAPGTNWSNILDQSCIYDKYSPRLNQANLVAPGWRSRAPFHPIQGYLAHKKHPSRRTLQ